MTGNSLRRPFASQHNVTFTSCVLQYVETGYEIGTETFPNSDRILAVSLLIAASDLYVSIPNPASQKTTKSKRSKIEMNGKYFANIS